MKDHLSDWFFGVIGSLFIRALTSLLASFAPRVACALWLLLRELSRELWLAFLVARNVENGPGKTAFWT